MRESPAISKDEPSAAGRLDVAILLSRLEQSLQAGQRALVVRDVERLEKETGIQASLSKNLAESLRVFGAGEGKLREPCSRVLHLCRMQLGLLRRAQRSLRVLANLMAGPESNYVGVAGVGQPTRVKTAVSRQEG